MHKQTKTTTHPKGPSPHKRDRHAVRLGKKRGCNLYNLFKYFTVTGAKPHSVPLTFAPDYR